MAGGGKNDSGKHLELTVPDLPVDAQGFSGCIDGHLKSWVSPMDTAEEGDAFYGYTGPGHVEEYWILDVDGTRLVIEAGRSAGSSAGDLSELHAVRPVRSWSPCVLVDDTAEPACDRLLIALLSSSRRRSRRRPLVHSPACPSSDRASNPRARTPASIPSG